MSRAAAVPLNVTPLGGQGFRVSGGARPHLVNAGGTECDCESHRYRPGVVCRHRRAVLAAMTPEPESPDAPGAAGCGLERDVPLSNPPGDLAPEGAPEASPGDGARAPASSAFDTLPSVHAAAPEDGPRVFSLARILEDPQALAPPAFVIPRLAWRGRVSLLVGREKLSGKSTLLTAGCAAVTRGREFLGERAVEGTVLWVSADQEHAAELVQRALRFGADPTRFHVLWPRNSFDDLNQVLDALEPTPALVVIDTLASFTQVEDPHSSAEWPRHLLPLLTMARATDIAVVLVHHANKSENGGYRDSSAIAASVDMLLTLTREGESVTRRQVAPLGRWPMSDFVVDLVGDGFQLLGADALTLDAKILAYVAQHPSCSKRAIRDGVGGRAEDVDSALHRLFAAAAIEDTGTDRKRAYRVTQVREPGSDDLPF